MTAPFAQPTKPKPMTVRELLEELRKVPEKDRDCVVMKASFHAGKVKLEPVFELAEKMPTFKEEPVEADFDEMFVLF